MSRKVYPTSKRDRRVFWLGVLAALAGIFYAYVGFYWLVAVFAVESTAIVILVYVFQDQPSRHDSSYEYSVVIAQIQGMRRQFSDLSTFLEKEQTRVAETEATLTKLNDEKTKLEPILTVQKETVEAILSAHTSRTARNAWKERVVGFVLGTLASMMATIIYQLFR